MIPVTDPLALFDWVNGQPALMVLFLLGLGVSYFVFGLRETSHDRHVRWLALMAFVVLSGLVMVVTPAAAQTSTPTATPTATPIPTLDFGYVFTLEPIATGQPALGAQISYQMNLDGIVSGVLVFAIWLTLLIAITIYLLQRKAPPKKP